MNRNEQLKALAGLDGYVNVSDDGKWGHLDKYEGRARVRCELPNYLGSLDEIQRLVMKVCPKGTSVRGYFNTKMERIMDDDFGTYAWEVPCAKWAEALLKTQTIELWKEDAA